MAKAFKFSIGKKTTAIMLVFAVILACTVILFSYSSYQAALEASFISSAESLVHTASLLLDGDRIDGYLESRAADEQYFIDLLMLRRLNLDERMEYLFVFKPTTRGQQYIYDTDSTSERYRLGYVDRWYAEQEPYINSFLSGEAIPPIETFSSEFGNLTTIYTPLHDSEGNVVAYVGADFDTSTLRAEKLNFLRSLFIIVSAITCISAVVYVVLIRRILVNPINQMAVAANKFIVNTLNNGSNLLTAEERSGTLTDLNIHSSDELGMLASNLATMERKINEYINHLDVATQLADRDAMTGLYNRSAFGRRVDGILRSGVDEGNIHAFIMIDLDDFKTINDTYGHIVGDQVLEQCATLLKSCFRASDLVSRMGGDEFAVFMTSAGSAAQVAEKVQRFLAGLQNIKFIEGDSASPAASIGISLYPTHGADSNTLYDQADIALYKIKGSQKNDYCFFGDVNR